MSWQNKLKALINVVHSFADESVKKNAKYDYDLGLSAKIVRTTNGKCCKWCNKLAGTYDYDKAPADVYRRHNNCDCIVEYVVGKRRQNAHTKLVTEDEIKQRKLRNEEVSQLYKPLDFGVSKTFKPRDTSIRARKVLSYDNVYVSENVYIKRRDLHEINQRSIEALKRYGLSEADRPTIVILHNNDLYGAFGKYDAINDVVYYVTDIANKEGMKLSGGVGYTEYHEMWHKKQAADYIKSGNVITEENYQEYIENLSKKCKKRIEELGITEYNAEEISDYAYAMYRKGRFDEVEAEFIAKTKRK